MTDERDSIFRRLRDSLIVRALVVYGGASWVVLEITSTFGDEFGLPTWFFPTAAGLLLIGLPIILGTAVVQSGKRRAPREAPKGVSIGEFAIELERGAQQQASARSTGPVRSGLASLLTWRRSILGGLLAFGALGLVGAMIVLRGTARVTEAYGAAGDEFEERAWIVVADFDVPEGEEDVAIAVREALTVDLQQSQYVNVFTRNQMAGVLRLMELPDTARIDVQLARDIAQRQGLAAVLGGRIAGVGDSYVLAARVIRPDDAEELIAVRTTASRDRLVDAIEALSRETRLRLGESRSGIGASKPLPEVTTHSVEALRRYAQSVEALARGDHAQAADLAEAAIDIDPEFAMAHRQAAVAHSNFGRPAESDRYIEQAYELRHKLSERERLHIEAFYAGSKGDNLEAIGKYELILSAYPDDSRAANNLAVRTRQIGDYERAYRSAMRSVELDPYISVGYQNAILNAIVLEKWEAAESLAYIQRSYGLQDQAIRWLWWLAVVTGDWERSDAICDSLLAVTSRRGVYRGGDEHHCASLDIARGRIEQGVERLRRATQIYGEREQHSDLFATTRDLVNAEILRGRPDAGRRALDQALERHPPDSMARADRVLALWSAAHSASELGDLARAQRYHEAYAADALEDWEVAWSHRLAAAIAVAEGSYEEALDYDRQGIEREYGREFIHDGLYRAQAFDGLGQADSAISLYEEVVAPRSMATGGYSQFIYLQYLPVTHRRLGELYDAAGNAAKAAQHYESFIELWSEADPELRPQVEAARQALQRLGAERATATSSGRG